MKRPPGSEMLNCARTLRREMTPQEKILWGQLRGRRFEGFKFRRQMWLSGFVADFACPQARLVVEADGSQHAEQIGYDDARSAAFERLNWRTLRFWNNEINTDLDAVLAAIRAALPPLPLGEREGPARAARGRVRAHGDKNDIPSPDLASLGHPLPCREREI
jgi:very-short-patch-repair endonuclease